MLTKFVGESWYRRSVACASAVALVASLSSCAQRADGSIVTAVDDIQIMSMSSEGLEPASARQLERAQRYAEMRLGAAAGGAVIGALAGALLGGDNALAGAGIGAVAGGALGYLGGAYVANLNSQAEDRRANLNVQLSAAKAAVREQEVAVRDSRDIVRSEKSRLDRTLKDYRAGRIAKDQASKQVDESERRLTIINEAINAAKDDITGVDATIKDRQANSQNTGGLPRELKKLRAQEAALVKQRNSLLTAFRAVPAELDPPKAEV